MEERPVIESFLATRTEEAFCALVEVICVRVHRYLLLRGLDHATAEELTQNVLLKVYRQAGELRGAENFYGWLFTIARNEMVSYWRSRQARIETVALDSLAEAETERLSLAAEVTTGLRLTDWLQVLAPADQDLLLLRFVEGLSYEELADSFKLPLGTIKWRLFNARKKLARIMLATSVCQGGQAVN